MKKIHYIIAGLISLVCIGAIVLRWLRPKLIIDQTTVLLLTIAILPWLTVFFKKLKIPGVLEGETHERLQGTTEKPPPPKQTQEIDTSIRLSNDAKKILATLWKYQKQTFKNDYTKRWTFKVFSHAPQFSAYLAGLSELMKLGLVVVSPDNEQCMLTNEGINFIESSPDLQEFKDIYKF